MYSFIPFMNAVKGRGLGNRKRIQPFWGVPQRRRVTIFDGARLSQLGGTRAGEQVIHRRSTAEGLLFALGAVVCRFMPMPAKASTDTSAQLVQRPVFRTP
jgi:hypothetical protein